MMANVMVDLILFQQIPQTLPLTSLYWVEAIPLPKLYPKLSVETNGEQMFAVTGEEVTANHANSKRYFIKDEKPTDDEGFIGDVCFVIGG